MRFVDDWEGGGWQAEVHAGADEGGGGWGGTAGVLGQVDLPQAAVDAAAGGMALGDDLGDCGDDCWLDGH